MDEIVQLAQSQHNWPAELARQYLTKNLEFDFTPRHRQGLERFFGLCHKHGILQQLKPIHYLDDREFRSANFEVGQSTASHPMYPCASSIRNSKLEIRNPR
jgi:hypothetical protein